jgi:hypothetical protein
LKTKAEYRSALSVVRTVIHQWDPYGLLAEGAPRDEFDREIASVVSQISRIKSSKDASRVVSRVFSSSFERNLFRPDHCAEVGENLYAALKAHDLLK